LFGGGAQKVDPLIGWPVGRRKGRGQRAGGRGGGSKPSRGNHYASGQPFNQSTLSLVGHGRWSLPERPRRTSLPARRRDSFAMATPSTPASAPASGCPKGRRTSGPRNYGARRCHHGWPGRILG